MVTHPTAIFEWSSWITLGVQLQTVRRAFHRHSVNEVEVMLTLLHAHGFVFGDLRGPNLMLRDDTRKVVLIDCDWIGRDGNPSILS